MSEITVRVEREQIEVTRDGSLPPFKADHHRVFIPGLTTVYVTIDGVDLPPMTPDEYEVWAARQPGARLSAAGKGGRIQ